jgi:hypothetical protein
VKRKWIVLGSTCLVLGGIAAFVLVYFAPQDLLLQTSVDEPVPTATVSTNVVGEGGKIVRRSPPALVVVARGTFSSGEHTTTGRAQLLALGDGRRFVRLTDLVTSNGPEVRIWLSAAPNRFSDDAVAAARHVDLGGLKANHGNQNYAIPSDARVRQYRSVVIWCRRFNVVFGAAPLLPADHS